MAKIVKDFNTMGLPMAIYRNEPIPLDSSAVWYTYEEMAEYASNNPTAYVGQILGLVDATNRTATAYIITSVAGALKEVGAATVVDEHTIVINNGALALHDFGVAYYKYIAATDTAEAKYVRVVVGDIDPDTGVAYEWKNGLEPKVVIENGEAVLGWYEPNPTTMEGVSANIASLQNSIDAINTNIGNLEKADDDLEAGVAAINTKLKNIYTKTETDSAIAAAVSAADHLKREVVTELPSVDDADLNTIYMIASGLQDDDNKYYEWMVINGAWEQIGSWEVDLSSYAKKTEVEAKVDKVAGHSLVSDEEIAKLATVETGAQKNYIKSVDTEFTVDANGKLNLESVPNDIDLKDNESIKTIKGDLEGAIATKVTKESGKSLVSDELIEKLEALPADAEKNVIASVSDEFAVSDDRELSIVKVDGSKIDNLANNADFAEAQSDITALETDVGEIQATLAQVSTTLTSLNSDLSNTKASLSSLTSRVDQHDLDIAELYEMLTWQELK